MSDSVLDDHFLPNSVTGVSESVPGSVSAPKTVSGQDAGATLRITGLSLMGPSSGQGSGARGGHPQFTQYSVRMSGSQAQASYISLSCQAVG